MASDDHREFKLIESFGIDDGELGTLSQQECFVLGYEMCSVIDRANSNPEEFDLMIHSDNEKRVRMSMAQKGRPCIVTWEAGDVSESWLKLTVLKKILKED